jgi:hypothetical protein
MTRSSTPRCAHATPARGSLFLSSHAQGPDVPVAAYTTAFDALILAVPDMGEAGHTKLGLGGFRVGAGRHGGLGGSDWGRGRVGGVIRMGLPAMPLPSLKQLPGLGV